MLVTNLPFLRCKGHTSGKCARLLAGHPEYPTSQTTLQSSFHDLPAPNYMDRQYCQSRDRCRPQCRCVLIVFSVQEHNLSNRCSQGLYSFLIAYLAAPVTGIPMDSSHIVEFVHSVPEWLQYTAKGIVALPFTFHSLNGIRHLAWDLVKGMYATCGNP